MVAACSAGSAGAQTLYKSIGADGRATYTDRLPEGATGQALTFDNRPRGIAPAPPSKAVGNAQTAVGQAAARTAITPVLYTATWCGYCRLAKAYLNQRQIAYREVDVETADGRSAFAAVGRGGVPLMVAGDRKLRGFAPDSYDAWFAGR